jgi:hypothetical protein
MKRTRSKVRVRRFFRRRDRQQRASLLTALGLWEGAPVREIMSPVHVKGHRDLFVPCLVYRGSYRTRSDPSKAVEGWWGLLARLLGG